MRRVYIAFPDISNDPGPVWMVKYYEEKYGAKIVPRYPVGTEKPLKDVKAGDMVIVVGHGNFDMTGLAVSTTKENYLKGDPDDKLTANTLALFLKHDGLPISHRFIKCATCCGGVLRV